MDDALIIPALMVFAELSGPLLDHGNYRPKLDSAAMMLIEATPVQITFQFINRYGELIDSYEMDAAGRLAPAMSKLPRVNPFLRPGQWRVE